MNLEQFLSVHLSFQYILTLKKSEAGDGGSGEGIKLAQQVKAMTTKLMT